MRFPIVTCRRFLRPLIWWNLFPPPPTMIHLRVYIWPADLDSFWTDLAFSQICIFFFSSHGKPATRAPLSFAVLLPLWPAMAQCAKTCEYISISVCVVTSLLSLMPLNMETSLTWRSLNWLDIFALSHVSARAWRIVSILHWCSLALSSSLGVAPAPIGLSGFIVLSTACSRSAACFG